MPADFHEKIFSLVAQNWTLKLLALLLAILTLVSVRSVTREEATYLVPVQPVIPEGASFQVVEQDPVSVRVTLRGSREDLRRVDTRYLKAVVHPSPGEHQTVRIRSRHLSGTYGTRVVGIEPDVVRFVLAPRPTDTPSSFSPPPSNEPPMPEFMTREWTNVSVFVLLPPASCSLAAVLIPSNVSVTLRGPPAEIAHLRPPLVFVDGSDLSPSTTVERLVRVYPPGGHVTVVSAVPDRVTITPHPTAKGLSHE